MFLTLLKIVIIVWGYYLGGLQVTLKRMESVWQGRKVWEEGA